MEGGYLDGVDDNAQKSRPSERMTSTSRITVASHACLIKLKHVCMGGYVDGVDDWPERRRPSGSTMSMSRITMISRRHHGRL
jgi:hypothetical protein